jgi:hypothetical protein
MVSILLSVSKCVRSAPLPAALLASACLVASATLQAGSLTPPGAPVSTMKTMDQVEPRTPIGSLPYNITTPGSYYLTKNLQGGSISVLADNVTIDLCGFTLTGAGVSNGIVVGSKNSLTVRNGKIVSFTQNGIAGSSVNTTGTLLENLTVAGCGGKGIVLGPRSIVVNCIAESNGGSGIYVRDGSVVMGCATNDNGNGSSGSGIEAGPNCRVVNCTASGNDQMGIWTETNASVQGCTSGQNVSNGINVGNGGIVSHCSSRENKSSGISTGLGCTVSECSVSSNTYVGIYSGDRSLIERCTVTECAISQAAITAGLHTIVRQCEVTNNWGTGISCNSNCFISLNNCSGNGRQGSGAGINVSGNGSRIEDNNVSANPSGISCVGTSNFVLRNTMQGNTSNYTLGAGNIWGTIVANQTDMNNAANANVNIAIP